MSPTQPLAATRADSQDAAVEKQPSTETVELLSEEDEEIEGLGFDPPQSSDDKASPSVFLDGVEDMKILRATLVRLKIISRGRGATLDEISATMKRVIARNDFIRRQVTREKEPLSYLVTTIVEAFEDRRNYITGEEWCG